MKDNDEQPCKRARHLCSLGTGEVVHVLSYKALPDKIDAFEIIVQGLARCVYCMEASVTDVRVCHPCCGEVVFVFTFISKDALEKFRKGPQAEFERSLHGIVTPDAPASPTFSATGTLMPAAHTLSSLVEFLKANIKGSNHSAHNVRMVSRELEKWFPRPSEYQRYIQLDQCDATKYTRNLIYGNEHFDCILMCWPPGSQSTIHDHDVSSCWVAVVEGTVYEVQYALPRLDKKFIEMEQRDPATAVGNCGKLKVINVACLDTGGVTGTYANNEIGIHRVENRSDKLACTLHVYAPPLRKMKIFDENGCVKVCIAENRPACSGGSCKDQWVMPCEGIFDVEAW
eukprot:CAMPEP_0185022458 /NCGR_PEP_ID=MMETSP1103-20130426/5166_1 /TAXON_ID=36769 /ORGANISM="Paraphysomonas bandaiensis, Strain Caron Lab Isolate" /LENGTH=341 /DNA_ID=CAMNT_0027554529 /DNA_START=84 /DNA_END=1106 /DNA_ORIENTATION=+